jgi:hypothetical protein
MALRILIVDDFGVAGLFLARFVSCVWRRPRYGEGKGSRYESDEISGLARLFEDALQECEPEKILGQVSASETAMTSRMQAPRTAANGDDERQAIADAANALVN